MAVWNARAPQAWGSAATMGAQTAIDPRQLAAALGGQKSDQAAPPTAQGADWASMLASMQDMPQSHGLGEAILNALAGGIRGRAAHDERMGAQKQREAQNQWAQTLQQHQQGAWNTEDKQNERLNDWASAQGPDAQVDPAGAYQAYRAAHQPLTSAQQADVDLGRARLAEEQRYHRATEGGAGGGSGFGRAPMGYRYRQDGTLEPIPGGPAADRSAATANRNAGRILSQMSQNRTVLTAIARARDYAHGFGSTGVIGNTLQGVPTTNANALHNELQTIRANIGFDKLADMRANSPTGGALGNVSDRETALLQNVLGSLEQSQTQTQFLQHLSDLERTYTESMQRLQAAYQQDVQQFGAENVPPPPQAQQTARPDPLGIR